MATSSLLAGTIILTPDTDGADDWTNPNRNDLNLLGYDDSTIGQGTVVVAWSFDDTNVSNGEESQGCALFDTDGDGNVNYSLCSSLVSNNGIGELTTPILYNCTDTKTKTCSNGGGDGTSGTTAFTGACQLSQIADPFAGTASHQSAGNQVAPDPNEDSLVTCTVNISDLSEGSTFVFSNVCTYPSGPPNADDKDCVVAVDSGFLQIVKTTTNGADDTFSFTLNGGSLATVTTSGGTGQSDAIAVAGNTTYNLAETVDPDWVLNNASCDNGDSPSALSVDAKERVTCTFVNSPAFVPAPAISLTKSGILNDGGNGATPGDIINYSFTVQNVGNINLLNIAISDLKIGTVTCPKTSLAADSDGTAPFVGESMICTGTYAITQSDINTGHVDNTATVSGSDGSTTVQDTADAQVTIPRTPQIMINKEGALNLGGDNLASIGDLINYTLAVTNTGNVTLQNVTVTDPKLTNINCGGGNNLIGTLAPGGTALCIGSYAITQADINTGSVDNTAQVTGASPTGGNVGDTDTNTETIPQNPALSLVKASSLDAGSDGIATPGDLVNYTLTVMNTGNVTLQNVTVNDPLLTNINCANTNNNVIGTMQPGDTVQCTGSYSLAQTNIDAGKVDNTATVSGTDPKNQPVGDNDQNTQVIPQTPLLAIVKDGALTVGSDNEATPGDLINYSFAIKNAGNVTLNNVVVSDPLLTNINCGSGSGTIGTMLPGATVQCTGSYAITQTNINASKVDNTADVNGNAPNGDPVNDEDSHTEDIPQMPAITIVKTGVLDPGSDGATPGDFIHYTFAVTNTGNVTLNNVTVVDPKAGTNCVIGTLAPGATHTTCVGTYAITQDDINAGSVDNIATVSGIPPIGDPVNNNDDYTEIILQQPSLAIDKEGTVNLGGDNRATVGDVINYTFVVENTGNVTLNNVTVSDGKLNLTCTIGTLAPGAVNSTSCTGSYVLTQTDINAGKVDNTATVTGTPPNNGTPVSAQDPNTEGLASIPSIALTKVGILDTGSDGVATPGDVINYTFQVENTGNVTLDTILVTDSKLGVSCTITDPLQPGESDSTTCTGVYAITQQDIDDGSVTNQAQVSALTPNDTPVTDNADNTTEIPPSPAIELRKDGQLDIGSDGIANVGDQISYTFVVTNSGNVTLNNITITDPKLNLTCTIPGSLVPGATNNSSCTGTYILTQTDVDAGLIQNTATVTGTPPAGSPVTANDTKEVAVPQDPQITIDKVGTLNQGSDGLATPGDIIDYTFAVQNTGNVTLKNVVVTDAKLNLNCFIGTLAPGAIDSTTCTGQYVIAQPDIDAGIVENRATATGSDPNDAQTTDNDDEQVAIPADPAIIVEKDGTLDRGSDGLATPNDTIDYTFVVRNTGNVSLDNIVVTDAKLALSCTIPGTLAPGASDSTTCSATYILTQTDIDAGFVVNTALVTGDTPTDEQVQDSDENTEPISVAPSITLDKDGLLDLDTNNVANPGDLINYTFSVENTGNVTLDNVVVTDPKLGLTCTIGTLLPGATHTTCTGTYAITQTDIDAGFVDNLATVSGTPRGSTTPITDDAPNRESIPQTATISIIKTGTLDLGTDNQATPGDQVTYQFTVQNTSNVTLNSVVVSDPLLGLNCNIGTLAPGATDSTTCQATYSLTQGNIDVGQVDNTATVTARTPTNTPVSNSDDYTVVIGQSAQLAIDKQVREVRNPNDTVDPLTWVDQAGDTIIYDIVVTNRGNVTLHDVTVDDDRTNTVNALCGNGTLLPGQSCTVTVQYTVLQSEINDNGGGDHDIDNTATADSTETAAVTDSAAVEIAQADVGLRKSVDNAFPAVGEIIQFTIQVTNTGPAVATGVDVVDILPSGFATITNASHGGVIVGNVVTWRDLTIPVDGAVNLTVEATVLPPTGAATGYINTAQVTASNQGDPDSVPNNNDPDEDDQDSIGVTVRGSIYIAKITMGGDDTFGFDTSRDTDTNADFSILTTNGSGENLTALKNILPGAYTITEIVPAGWALTDTYCRDINGEFYRSTTPVATLDLQPGQVVQCYFVNLKLGSVTIAKRAIGGNGAFGFDSTLGAGTVNGTADFSVTTTNGSGSRTFTNLMPGTYPVQELLPNGWALTALTCTGDSDGDTTVDLATRQAEIHLDAGEAVTCTYENTRYSSITVVKTLSDAAGRDRGFDFTSSTLANNSFTLTTVNGSASRSFGSLLPGSYDINEVVPNGWQLKSIVCTGDDSSTVLTSATGADIDLAAGENLTCTFTNDPLPTATVDKNAGTLSLMEPGGTVQFTVVVRNTSPSEPLRLTALVDNPGNRNLASVCPLPTQPLAPAGQAGDTFTCVFSSNVTGAPGEYTDIVTATLRDDEDNVITPSDTATVTIFDVGPAAGVTKTASPSTLPEPGGRVTFTVDIRNLSTVEALTLSTLVDDPYGNITTVQGAIVATSCQVPQSIPVGGSYNCHFTVNLQGQPGFFSDTVTATLSDNDENQIQPTGDATVAITDVDSELTVIKSAMPAAVPEAGGYVTFTIEVINTSPVDDIRITAINDDIYGAVCGTTLNISLAPGASHSCEFVRFVEGETGEQHVNVATASATDDDGKQLTAQDDATVLISDTPATLHVHKQANRTEIAEPGGNIRYTVVVENQSTVDRITLEKVVDDRFGNVSNTCTPALPVELDLGESVTCTFTRRVTGNAGDLHVNIVTATGTDDDGLPVSDSDQEEVRIDNVESSIKVLKLSDPTSVPEPGGMVTFTVLVTNTSPVDTVTIQNVVDDQFGNLNSRCAVPANGLVLAPGESLHCEFTEYVSGPTGGLHTNTVTATGIDDEGNALEDYDVEHVDILDLPSALLVAKVADRNTVPENGAIVTFTVVARNASLVDAITVETVVDDLFGDVSATCKPALPIELLPGETITCQFSEFIDGAVGTTHRNVVTVAGIDDDEQAVSAEDDAEIDITDVPSSIKVVKTANRTSVDEPGDDVTFTVTIENTSAVDNVTLRRLDDDQFGDLRDHCPVTVWPITLEPGQVLTCIFTEFVGGDTGANHRNVVTASGVDDDGFAVSDFDDEIVGILDLVPTITVSKDARPTFIPESGGLITFTVAVVNPSTVETVTLASLVDSIYGDLDGVGSCQLPQTLAPNDGTYRCAFSRFVRGDVDADHVNRITATAFDDEENAATDSDDAQVVFGDIKPSMEVVKSPSATTALDTGEAITFTIKVINTGQETITLTSLVDTIFGDLDGLGNCATPQVIGIGATYSCRFTETIAGASGTAHVNEVEAIAEDNEGNTITDTDDATVTFGEVEPLVEALKSATLQVDTFDDPEDAGKITPGDTLRYHLELYNRGNAQAEDVVLLDIPDPKTALVVGSVTTTKGTVLEGNKAGDTQVRVLIGTLAPNQTETVRITFDVVIDPNTESTILRNQAIISLASKDPLGLSLPSDDPSTPKEDDPTLTEVVQIPTALPGEEEPLPPTAIFLPIVFR